MTHNKEEDEIKFLLKDMPRIQDDQTKEQLYTKITNELDDKQSGSNKKVRLTWMVPSLLSIAVLFLVVVIVQNSNSNDMANESLSGDQETATEESADSATFEIAEEKAESSQANEAEGSMEDSALMDTALSSHLVFEDDLNRTIIHLAGTEPNLQSVIPVTLIEQNNNREPEHYYNQLDLYVNEDELGITLISFEGITFDLLEEENRVVGRVKEDFKIKEGTAFANMFVKVLSTMFTPLQIEEIIVESDQLSESQFGPLDVEDNRLPLINEEKLGYKVYQFSNNHPELLVPTYRNFDTIEEALAEMQKSEPEFNLKAAIPNDTSYTLEGIENQLTITFTDSEQFGNNQITVNMIESILMTAKSYGFTEVQFQLPIDHVGEYTFDAPIQIPIAVNPYDD
ncbi:hypothetical protein [Aquibacillus rhizosphaerae]|uniref:GerMN domain-containing protein n=1 Tax=Aquibacillus rhizosphaerae TaxID=3051431 RepID=A0ABT7L4H1_9BACI|nr:hypothetical protein [Aquibacillus sp. LR5S19]MDL4840765.1 hypothetical protein [Aquibacillus sp. LR5S19]